MDFLAATKEGIVIYDAMESAKKPASSANGDADAPANKWEDEGRREDDHAKVVKRLPGVATAVGHSWSKDGKLLASVCEDGVIIYDATKDYEEYVTISPMAENQGNRVGGIRTTQFSPMNSYIVCYEKWDPAIDHNVHVWDLREGSRGTRLYSCCLRNYASGGVPVDMVRWTFDESISLEFVAGEGLRLRNGDFSDEEGEERWISSTGLSQYVIAGVPHKGDCYVSCFLPEQGSRVARLVIYHLSDPKKPTKEIDLPKKVKDCKMLWNCDGSAMLALAGSDVDESGNSYFGTSYLYWLTGDGKKEVRISGAEEGLVQDLCWSPTANEFMTIVGMMPATVALYDGKTGKLSSTLGVSRRNVLKWNPFGKMCAVGGFGTLPGDMDFWDRSTEETVSSLRAALTVECQWAPDGRHFLTSTIAPRMNEGNQISIYKYSGERIIQMDFKPEVIEARHADTGAGARTKTQALLFTSSWRPAPGVYTDRPITPRPGSKKGKKGLPQASPDAKASSAAAAYRPRGQGESAVAAAMRGEVEAPAANESRGGRWDVNESLKAAPMMEEWEVKKMQKEAKKVAELKAEQDKEAVKQANRDLEKSEKDHGKKIKAIKAQLEEIELLKDKEWDEMTEEDEAVIETEIDLRAQLAELEKQN